MEVYRISRAEYIEDLTGTGAKKYGGRWNRPGLAVLYTSSYRSLAILELLVHFESRQAFASKYSMASLYLPEKDIISLDKNQLPYDQLMPNDERLWQITDRVFGKENQLALKVPSLVLSEEYNLIINPLHPKFGQVSILETSSVNLDERFKKIL
jgi:RES domain-containing protein